MLKLLLLIVYVATSLFGLYKLKSAPIGPNFDFLMGFCAYGLGVVLWLSVLKLYPLSIAFPLAAGALIVGTQLVGVFFLQEAYGTVKLVGVALLLTGLATLAASDLLAKS